MGQMTFLSPIQQYVKALNYTMCTAQHQTAKCQFTHVSLKSRPVIFRHKLCLCAFY